MADDLDLESWLEAPYKNDKASNSNMVVENTDDATKDKKPEVAKESEKEEPKGEDKERHRSKDKERSKDKDRESSSRHRSDSRSHTHRSSRHRSRSRERRSHRSRRSPSRERRHRRERSRERRRDDRDDRYRESRRPRSPVKPRSPSPIVDEHDRDQRTVFCTQLAARLTSRELKEFFSQVGKVRDARIVSDRNSRRSKGVGYVEFYTVSSVDPAIALSGQKLLGIPIIVQASEAEKNRYAEANTVYNANSSSSVPYHRLYVGNLQPNLTREDLKQLFDPFGPIDFIELPTDIATGRGRGYAFIQYRRMEDARTALAQMNGFELGGRPIKVGLVSDKGNNAGFSLDEADSGLALNSHSRTELMKKLARQDDIVVEGEKSSSSPSISRYILLENMFDPETETEPNWETELEEEVEDECNKFGRIRHISLDGKSKGNIYIKFDSTSGAQRAIQGLHGRWFGGRQVVAKYLTEKIYYSRFPEA
ncbi:splicing factor, CC1-like protein [Neoconidiobolus thromboides FSU 785]|nr:splicing factor, CC1-like protein [Neoconidiobolus thromboides FSU 785]